MGKVTWLVTTALVFAFFTLEAQSQSPFSDQQVEQFLRDKKMVKKQVYCLVGRGECDETGNIIKSQASYYLKGCGFICPPDIARQLRRVMQVVRRSYPREATEILKRYG